MKNPRFLVDVNIGSTVIRFLESEGYDVTTIASLDPRMSDEEILRTAHKQARILLTVDKDFGDLIYHRRLKHRGVIRIEDTTPARQIQYLELLLKKFSPHLWDNFIVAQRGVIRIRTTKP